MFLQRHLQDPDTDSDAGLAGDGEAVRERGDGEYGMG